MRTRRAVPLVAALLALAAACGDGDAGSDATSTTAMVPATSSVPTSTPPTTTPPTTGAPPTPPTTAPTTTPPATSAESTPPTTAPVVELQPAVWPAPGTVMSSPEAAAADFLAQVFRVDPLLGAFQPGDGRSGEIEVLSPLDDDDPATTSPTGVVLLLRRLGPDEGWFVLGVVSEGVSITAPASAATVPAGPTTVTGLGRGFESTVVVRAFVAGDATTPIDIEITMTDRTTPLPYSVDVDLTGIPTGTVVAIVAQGDIGLSNATGEFAAIPIVVGG